VNDVKLPAGSVIKSMTGGGGGYGNPAERDPADIREDLLDGYILPEHAEQIYGYSAQ